MLTSQRLTRADVASQVAVAFTAPQGEQSTAAGRIGVEIEWIPARTHTYPPGAARVALSAELIGAAPELAADGRVTYEPGGQVEMSPPPSTTVADLLAHLYSLEARLRAALKLGGVELFSSGVDPWHSVDELGLQTPGPRYSTMQAHFDAIGPAGRQMMRQTAALQVCLDLGGRDTSFERWLLANRAGPALSAAFANSPVLEGKATGTPGTRSTIWQRVDSSRTGFDGAQVGGDASSAIESYLDFALNAVFIPLSDNVHAHASESCGLPFAELVAAGHAPLEASDVTHHLSTLFPPVRPRGHLEVRYLDALPSRWLPVAVTVLATLLYEPRATREALEALDGNEIDGPAWQRSGTLAMQDAALRSTALTLFDVALRGVPRMPAGFVPPNVVRSMSEYRERFPEAGRTPADDQLESFMNEPEALATWR